MALFDIFKKRETYKGFVLSPKVDTALQKALIDRGRGSEINSLTPQALSQANTISSANSTPAIISTGSNSLEPKLYDRFQPEKERGFAMAALQEAGRLSETEHFKREISDPIINKTLQKTADIIEPVAKYANEKIIQPGYKKLEQSKPMQQFSDYVNAVDLSSQGLLTRDDGSVIMTQDLPMAQQLAGGGMEVAKNITRGISATIESMMRGLQWRGVEQAAPLADKLEYWQAEVAKENPNFADQLGQGIGSAVTYFVPGFGVAKLSGVIGLFNPKIASIFGAGTMTALEAMSEAGMVWHENLKMGKTKEEADKAAERTFLANAAVLYFTNKIAYFGKPSSTLKGQLLKLFISSQMEGVQEFSQELIANWNTGKRGEEIFEGSLEAYAIGSIIGVMGGGFSLEVGKPIYRDPNGKPVAIPEESHRVEDGKETKYFETAEEASKYVEDKGIQESAVVTQLATQDNLRILEQGKLSAFPFESGISQQQTKIDEAVNKIQTDLGVNENEARAIFDVIHNKLEKDYTAVKDQQSIFDNASDQVKTQLGITPNIIEEAKEVAGENVNIKAVDEKTQIQEKLKTQAELEAEKFVTTAEAAKASKLFPFIRSLNIPVVARKQILSRTGEKVFGKYSKGMIEFVENPKTSTIPHEAVHAYMDIMLDPKEKAAIIDEAKKRFAGKIATAKKTGRYKNISVKGLSETAIAEEILAEDMVKYLKTGKAASNKLKRFYDWFVLQIKNLLGSGNRDKIAQFYADVQSEPGVIARKKARARMEGSAQEFKAMQEEFLQDPEALTTRALENVDIKNREFSSYDYLTQVMKSLDKKIKKAEWNLVNDVLQSPQFKDQKKINMEEFRAAIRSELMPFQIIETSTYSDYGVDENDRTVSHGFSDEIERTVTYIINTPYDHGYQGHFTGDFEGRVYNEGDLKIMFVSKEQAAAQGQNVNSDKYFVVDKDFHPDVSMTEEDIQPYVHAVKNTEELAQKWIDEAITSTKTGGATSEGVTYNVIEKKTKTPKGMLAHVRVAYMNDGSAKILEIQSDTMQKKSLEDLAFGIKDLITEKTNELNESITSLQDKEKAQIAIAKANKLANTKNFNDKVESNDQFGIDFRNAFENAARETHGLYTGDMIYNESKIKPQAEVLERLKLFSDFNNQNLASLTSKIAKLKEDIKRLESGQLSSSERAQMKHSELFKTYYQNWYEMAAKQTIRLAALEGVTSISFPTAYTANLIENWDGQSGETSSVDLDPGEVAAGNIVEIYGETYTITDVNEDGTFYAVPGEPEGNWDMQDLRSDYEQRYRDDMDSYYDTINEHIANDWDNVRQSTLDELKRQQKVYTERKQNAEKEIERAKQELDDLAKGQAKMSVHDALGIILESEASLFTRMAPDNRSQNQLYFYFGEGHDVSPAQKKAALDYLDSVGVKYFEDAINTNWNQDGNGNIIVIGEQYLKNENGKIKYPAPPLDSSDESIIRSRLEEEIRHHGDTVKYEESRITRVKNEQKDIKDIDKQIAEGEDPASVINVEENSDLFDREIEAWIDQEVENIDLYQDLSEQYGSVFEYEPQNGNDVRYLVFNESLDPQSFDAPGQGTDEADVSSRREEFERNANFTFPDIEIWAKNSEGEKGRKERVSGGLVDGLSEQKLAEMSPEEITAFRKKYHENIKEAIAKANEEQMEAYNALKEQRTEGKGRIDNVVEPKVYPVRMVFNGLDAEYQGAAYRYERDIPAYVEKLKGKENVKRVNDEHGLSWFEAPITPEDKGAVEAFQTEASLSEPIRRSGQEVADYVEEVQNLKTDGEFEPLSSYMRGVIANQNYELNVIKIKDLLKNDPDLRDYVEAGEQRYQNAEEMDQDNIELPIVVGTWGDQVGVVLDGYNRTLTKYQRGDEVIEAWISQSAIPESDRKTMIAFIDYARLRQPENVQLEVQARYVAEGMGINPNIGNAALANRFEDKLSKEAKYQMPAEPDPEKDHLSSYVGVPPKEQGMTPERRDELVARRDEMQRELYEREISEELEIQAAREADNSFTDPEKEVGYQNFVDLARRRPWMLEPQTDEMTIKTRIEDINIDNRLFSGATDMTNNQLLEMFKERMMQDRENAQLAKALTPSEIASRQKAEALKVVKAAKVGKALTLKNAINVAMGKENPITITAKQSQLLKNRLRDMARAARTGAQFGRAEMRDNLKLAFATKMKDLTNIRRAIATYAQELPTALRGNLINAVATAKTELDAAKAFARIDAALKAHDNKEQIQKMTQMARKVKKAMASGSQIAVDYQKQIADILKDYNLQKPTQATIDKLNKLADYINRTPDANIPDHLLKRLEILTKKNAREMSTQDLSELNDLLLRLWHLGELKLEMKGKYDQRYIDKSVDELLRTTRNVNHKKLTLFAFYHAQRVTDSFDGYMNYKGYNSQLQKKISKVTTNAIVSAKNIVEKIITDVSAIKNDFTKQEEAAMMFKMAVDQGLYSQAQALIDYYAPKYGWESEADIVITPEMQATMDILRGQFQETVDRLAAVYEETENKPFIKSNKYFPLKYDKRIDKKVEIDTPTINQMISYQGKQVDQGFTFARKKGVKKVLRTDIFGVFAEAIAEQRYYIEVQPLLNQVSNIVSQPRYQEALGEVGSRWWDRYLKGVANKGKSLNRGIFDYALKKLKTNLSYAIMGYRVTSALIQPSAIIDAYAYVFSTEGFMAANRLIAHFVASFTVPGYAKKIIAQSPGLQNRVGGELTLREMQAEPARNKVVRKFQEGSMWTLQKLDMITAAAVNRSMYKHYLKKGLSPEQAQFEADYVVGLTQASSSVADLPIMLMEGELYKTILTFQTFALNQFGLITHDLYKAGVIKGRIDRKFRSLIGLLLIGMITALGEEMRRATIKFLAKREYADKFNFWQDVLWTFPASVPIIGNIASGIVEFNRGFSFPLSRTIENLVIGAKMFTVPAGQTKEQKEYARKKGLLKFIEASASIFGMPGAAQISDLIYGATLAEQPKIRNAGGSSNPLLRPAPPAPPALPAPPKLPTPPMR